jgi:hypothetical protein
VRGRLCQHVPRVRPTELHALLTRWRSVADGGLDVDQVAALLGEVGPARRVDTTGVPTTSVGSHMLAHVAELDPDHSRSVRELADRIGCHLTLIERARAALRRAS